MQTNTEADRQGDAKSASPSPQGRTLQILVGGLSWAIVGSALGPAFVLLICGFGVVRGHPGHPAESTLWLDVLSSCTGSLVFWATPWLLRAVCSPYRRLQRPDQLLKGKGWALFAGLTGAFGLAFWRYNWDRGLTFRDSDAWFVFGLLFAAATWAPIGVLVAASDSDWKRLRGWLAIGGIGGAIIGGCSGLVVSFYALLFGIEPVLLIPVVWLVYFVLGGAIAGGILLGWLTSLVDWLGLTTRSS